MGRQQYLIRLALGRSPYEAPDNSNSNILLHTAETAQAHESSNNGSDYVQQYDERGHPTFPRSKALARDLRRAKNDVLSTMGVVVSGETGRPGTSRDKKRVKTITAENDYGLLVVAFDHITHFFGSWWIVSLMSRIQTLKRYSLGSLWDVVQSDVHEVGWTGVLFAGIPIWAVRIMLSICRPHLFEPLMTKLQQILISQSHMGSKGLAQNTFSLFRLSARALYFLLLEQPTHMFCFLQTLHLIPYSSFPTASFFIPFTASSMIRYPSFPTSFSLASFGQLASDIFLGPFAIVITYTFFRSVVEDRIYRIIRRQLPKQGQPDDLSIRVAVDNDLLEWTVPAAGRHMEYETYRSNLSMLEDIKEEFREFKKQVLAWLGWNRETPSEIKSSNSIAQDATETVRNRNRNRNHFETDRQEMDGAMISTPVQSSFDASQGQILANEQLTHSPAQITPVSLDGLRPVGQTEADSNIRQDGVETSWLPFQDTEQRSRSNTLFSRPASPESPLTSPRIRASLTHQNSFTTTMEISLQSSRNRQRTEQVDADVANLDTAISLEELNFEPLPLNSLMNDNELTILESMTIQSEAREVAEHDGIEDPPAETFGAVEATQSPENPDVEADNVLAGLSDENTLIPAMPATAQLTVLPDMVEEPLHSPTRPDNIDMLSDAGTQDLRPRSPPRDSPASQQRQQGNDKIQQRVTVLSSFPMDGLAHHLASMISSALFVPFRSLLHRSLATAYLSSPAAAVFSRNIAVSTTDIRSVNAFAGGGNRHDMITYMGNVAMVIGLQTVVSGSILSVSSTVAMQIGKRMFGWGQL